MATISEVLREIESERGTHEFIPTGFPKLDMCLDGGFLKKEIVLVGGNTGSGKSYLAIHLVNNAISRGFKSVYISLEISNHVVTARLLSMRSGIGTSRVLYDKSVLGDIDFLKAQAEVRNSDMLELCDNMYDIAAISKFITEGQFEFVVLDFIQNISAQGTGEYERLSAAIISLQKLAKSTNCCIVILSQLSNSVAKQKPGERSFEYKGSGAIGIAADLGFFYYQKEIDELSAHYGKNNITINRLDLAKNRRGRSGVGVDLIISWPGGSIHEQT